eukprot:CAMPEP_0176374978 /NCGR_PEP_ID=MMETSP0126-20121128/27174_1 /TAXON_ID=141414 ORGANISM="Strombidinopsis acuminatum, Strain SPMC142" /NCGR_SAMPLE_ID=MMETSP0126 /ASSEMBLY_ACC=CAM_ASM_000229 /LENGTH=100 /DNA_ID=CAMNT_0017735847 /DNA_START=350 /DNA_END=652 /DNA_ORIENTATION=+
MSGRIALNVQYPKFDVAENEHQFIVSGYGTEELQKEHMTKEVIGKHVQNFIHLSYIAIKPWTDESGKIIGSIFHNVAHVNVGGSIPKMVQNNLTARITKT